MQDTEVIAQEVIGVAVATDGVLQVCGKYLNAKLWSLDPPHALVSLHSSGSKPWYLVIILVVVVPGWDLLGVERAVQQRVKERVEELSGIPAGVSVGADYPPSTREWDWWR